MNLLETLRLRRRRKRYCRRATRKQQELALLADRTDRIGAGDLLCFATLRNERSRLPFFLAYYRRLGVNHFLMVDNGSDDGSAAFLSTEPDVSLWSTEASYRKARFGVDWLNGLQARYGYGHWTLVVDPDEFLVFPFCDTRPLRALTDWLDGRGVRSFSAMLLDLYPAGPLGSATYRAGQDPIAAAPFFDPGNYTMSLNPEFRNLWIQGGPRARSFFADAPGQAPSLNKIPLVKWQRGFSYVHSTHMLLPRGLNLVYDDAGGEKACGVLLHTKFAGPFAEKVEEELGRKEHFAGGREYRAYSNGLAMKRSLMTAQSRRFESWRQLEDLGLLSTGGWA